MKVTSKLKLRRETKGTYFYEVDTIPHATNPNWSHTANPNEPVRSLYLSKRAVGPGEAPKEITLTVEW